MYLLPFQREAAALRRCAVFLCVITLALAGQASDARAGVEIERVQIGVGYFDPLELDHESAAFEAMLQGSEVFWKLRPQVGVMFNTDGALYGFAGLNLPINLTDHLVLTPSLSAGAYRQGNSTDLDNVLEFRTAVDIGYRFNNGTQVSVYFYHLSNAGRGQDNPGTEIAGVGYSLPW